METTAVQEAIEIFRDWTRPMAEIYNAFAETAHKYDWLDDEIYRETMKRMGVTKEDGEEKRCFLTANDQMMFEWFLEKRYLPEAARLNAELQKIRDDWFFDDCRIDGDCNRQVLMVNAHAKRCAVVDKPVYEKWVRECFGNNNGTAYRAVKDEGYEVTATTLAALPRDIDNLYYGVLIEEGKKALKNG